MTLDLHAGQIQGFFDIPTDNLFAAPVMMRDIRQRFDLSKVIVVSPDVGGVVRARGLAKRINTPLAIVDKRRERPANPKWPTSSARSTAASASWSMISSTQAARW